MSVFGFATVQLPRGTYNPGDQVDGHILLYVTQPVPGSQMVWLQVSGRENTHLVQQLINHEDYMEGDVKMRKTITKIKQHFSNNYIVNHKFPIHLFNQQFLFPGQYSFPFSLKLPSSLPSSFDIHFERHGRACHGLVEYKMAVLVEKAGGGAAPAIFGDQIFKVNQAFVFDQGASKREVFAEINTCCCCSQGSSRITSYFEKNTYVPKETAYMITEVDNSKSKVPIKSITGSLEKRVKLQAGPYEDFVHKTVNSINIGGIFAGQSLTGQHARRIELLLKDTDQHPLVPTCGGTLIDNSYYLDNTIHLDVGCCTSPDRLTCRLNVVIRNPDDYAFSWSNQPSMWSPTMHQAYTAQFLSDYAGTLGKDYHHDEEVVDVRTEVIYRPPPPPPVDHFERHDLNTSMGVPPPPHPDNFSDPPPPHPDNFSGMPPPPENHDSPIMPDFPTDDTPVMPSPP